MRRTLILLALVLLGALAYASGYDLGRDERLGGHTLARHVARTDAQLRERLEREQEISAASTYEDRAAAERVIAEALARYASRLDDWKSRQGRRPNLTLHFKGGRQAIGRSLERGRSAPVTCYDAVIVLHWDDRLRDSYVLTSYPETRR
jgi:hypothetical protein